MDEIESRLRESTDAFIKSFENWVKQSKNLESRESLMEAMHEVRKVVSRVEIEIAISERDRLGSRPLPIPPHRSQRKSANAEVSDDIGNFNSDDDGDDDRQDLSGGNGGPKPRPQQTRSRRPVRNNNNNDSQSS